MSEPARGVLAAIAFQLAEALEHYQRDCTRLEATWFDPVLYRSVCDAMDRIQMYSTSLHGTSVMAVALLIAHSELVFTLWRGGDPARVRDEHAACVASMRGACLQRIGGQPS